MELLSTISCLDIIIIIIIMHTNIGARKKED